MNSKVLAGVVAVVVVIVVIAAAVVMTNGNDNENGGVTNGVNYHGNGGATSVGETVLGSTETTVLGPMFVYEGHVFTGWNTAADGSGTSYVEGAAISYGSGTIDLYAQWAYALTLNSNVIGPLSLSFNVYLVDENGNATALSIYSNPHALPIEGRAGIAVSIDGVTSWQTDGNVSTATDASGNIYTVTIALTGAEPTVIPGTGEYAAWGFTYSGPITCTLDVVEHQAN